ncbi:MAG TPA: hypothetical protein VHE35_09425 [Kofleriaceae bacterium]|nr:hypothetical protein [Kofleriaceae bacterium]
MRMVLGLVVLAACGGTPKPVSDEGTGSGSAAGSGSGSGSAGPPIAQTLLDFSASGFDAATHPQSKVYLEVTNHNGAMQSYEVGEVGAACAGEAGNGADIVTAMKCDANGTGAELRAVYRGTDIIVLRRNYTPDDDPADAELSFREVMRVPVPPGSSVKPAR